MNTEANGYLEQIQEVLQDEMVHAESEIDESDDHELWYDACETSDRNNCENINSTNTGDIDTAKAEDLDCKPLYENCPLTVGLSALLIITFAMRYLLAGKALHDLLELISLHCITPNYCFKSLFKFKKHFQHLKSPLKYHKYCARCSVAIDDNMQTCPNALCHQDLTVTGNVSCFIELPIEQQLLSMFGIPNKYDGNQYQKYFQGGDILSVTVSKVHHGLLV